MFKDQEISEIQTTLPVQGVSSEALKVSNADANQSYANGAVALGTALGGIFGEAKESKAKSGMASFMDRQITLADAVDQGSMSSKAARMHMRKNLSEFIAANPSYAQDLIDAQKDIIQTRGLGKIVDEGTEEEQRTRQMTSDASKAGFIPPNASEQDVAAGIERYNTHTAALTNLNLITKKLEVAGEFRDVESQRLESQAVDTMSLIASNGFDTLRAEFRGRMSEYTSSPQNKQDMLDWIAQTKQEMSAQIKLMPGGQYVPGDKRDTMLSAVTGYLDFLEESVNGDRNLKLMQNELAQREAAAKLMLYEDNPQLAPMVALSSFIGKDNPMMFTRMGEMAMQISAGMYHPKPKAAGVVGDLSDLTQKERQDSFKTFNNMIKGVEEGRDVNFESDQVQDAISSYINNTFKTVGDPRKVQEDSQLFTDALSFMAGNSFLTAMQNYKGGIDPIAEGNAKESIKKVWNDEIIPLIKDEFKNKKQIIVSSTQKFGAGADTRLESVMDRSNVIEPIFRNGSVVFVPLAGSEYNAHPNVRRSLNELNADLAPILTTMVKAQAHLEGNNDYLGQWEQIQKNAFPLRPLEQVEVDAIPEAQPAKPMTQNDFLYNEPIDAEDLLKRGNVSLNIDELINREGSGDKLTSNATGLGGLQVSEKKRLERKMGKGLSDKQAIKLHLEEGNIIYEKSLSNYRNAPEPVKHALLDAGYNMGYGNIASFDGMKNALANGDWVGTVANLLDTANVEGKTVRGVAKRRAYWYNQVSSNPIVAVEQDKDGTIRYLDANDKSIYSYKTPKGKHPKSAVGRIEVE